MSLTVAAQTRGLQVTWNISGKEFENVLRLRPEKRYEYFIKKVADWQEIWSLWKDGWVLMGDANHTEIVPVWPHPMFAEAFAVGEWLGYEPKRIGLDDWLTKWLLAWRKTIGWSLFFQLRKGKQQPLIQLG